MLIIANIKIELKNMNKQVPTPGIICTRDEPAANMTVIRNIIPHTTTIPMYDPYPNTSVPAQLPIQLINPQMIHPIQTANPTHGISPRHNANPSIAKNPNTTIGTVRHGTMTRMRQIRMR